MAFMTDLHQPSQARLEYTSDYCLYTISWWMMRSPGVTHSWAQYGKLFFISRLWMITDFITNYHGLHYESSLITLWWSLITVWMIDWLRYEWWLITLRMMTDCNLSLITLRMITDYITIISDYITNYNWLCWELSLFTLQIICMITKITLRMINYYITNYHWLH